MVSGHIKIYVEGGGDGANGKAELRKGFLKFFDELKLAAGLRLRVVACGGRSATYDDYRIAMQSDEQNFNVLLVDSEGPVNADPIQHLRIMEPSWNLTEIDKERCYLMIQTMEAWIISDIDSLSEFYGQKFRRSSIPNPENIESVEKSRLNTCLINSTRHTQKGEYHKIRHGSELLKRIDPKKVREKAPHCKQLFICLAKQIGSESLIRQYENE